MNNLSDLSVMALGGATVLYAIAMVAHAIRLARVADDKAAARSAAREAVAVGAPAPAHGLPVAEAPVASSPGGRAAKAAGIAKATTFMGAVLHGVGLLARGLDAGHVPWSNMYEYTISGSFFAVVAYLVLQRKRDVAFLGAGVTGLATVSLGLALTVLYKDVDTLPPALQSYWLVIHVSIATIVTGIFAVSFIATVLQLMRDSRDRDVRWGGTRFRWLEAVPTAANLEALSFRLNAVGFVLWTFTVMAGAIWAEHAWGRYWGWDPKEVWSFVIWVLYAAYLHARTTQGWAGRRSAWLAIAGFTALIMNFTVVNLFFQGLHTYAGS
ncbi:c-type cytochrome biogenesis protein CcsB [Demequina phytophila]|uniref:c-type cytochrome biogenesis protein CcsB n=1 Tax=Demequina phytophila TaxID=1638981 RepID=UPI000784A795|nr:c-type cytochrome biogenesis protein CcsB [Demequina phytophila]